VPGYLHSILREPPLPPPRRPTTKERKETEESSRRVERLSQPASARRHQVNNISEHFKNSETIRKSTCYIVGNIF